MQNIEQSRTQLSQAARRLVDAARGDIGAADVAAAAALPLASIAQAYGDFDTLLCELLGQMYDETRDLIARMTLNMPAGRSRLQVAIDAYLQRSEEHTSELQSLMRISYAVFCLKKKNITSQFCTTVATSDHVCRHRRTSHTNNH